MKLHHLKPAEGAKKDRKRVGRGRAGVRGKTAGRGTKGFTNPNRVEYSVVNVEVLGTYYADGEVTPEGLYAHGLVHKGRPVKILARGEIDHALTVKAHAFSDAAKAKIEAAGGRAELIG